jgi:hypothetical protein
MRVTQLNVLPMVAGVAMMAMVAVSPAAAQEQAPAQGQEAPAQEAAIRGQLVEVDAEAMTISVRTEQGAVERVRYNEQTQVTGAQDSVAGLASASEARVTVQVEGEGDARTATVIEVQPEEQR